MSTIRNITLGKTGITVPQNAFGALPLQRNSKELAVKLLRDAYTGGMRFFDTARAYSDSEIKVGAAFSDFVDREKIYIATKTHALTPDDIKKELAQSLENLRTDYVDLYQLHCAGRLYAPGDGTGLYETLQELKDKGKIRHIGITAHKIGVAEEIAESGLYETLQFPFSYLASERDVELVRTCKKNDVGFIAMKGLSGGLITNAAAAFACIYMFDNVLPIWGIQREEELSQWLEFMENPVSMTPDIMSFVEAERKNLSGDFCRGCGYCMPCPVGITINQCARMSLMIRRAPSAAWLTPEWQEKMSMIKNCLHCNACKSKCPYELDIPNLLIKNLEDYESVIRGETKV